MVESQSLVERADQLRLALVDQQPLSSRIRSLSGSWLGYVTRLLKRDAKLACLGKAYCFTAPRNVVISPSFFRHYSCECCGRCCGVDTHLFYTGPEMAAYNITAEQLKQIGFDSVQTDVQNLNDNSVRMREDLFVSSWNVKGGSCVFFTADKRCTIWDRKPVQCQLTPMHVNWSRKGPTARLTSRLFGRNWRFGCKMAPVVYTPKELLNSVRKLQLLSTLASYYGFDTWLPEIVARLEPCLDPDHSLWRRKTSFSGVVISYEGQIVKGVW